MNPRPLILFLYLYQYFLRLCQPVSPFPIGFQHPVYLVSSPKCICYDLDDRGLGSRQEMNPSLLQNTQTDFGALPASCSTGTGVCSQGKAAGS